MSYGSYSPGVTGNEYRIAGPDYEQEYPGYCPECGVPDRMLEYGFRREAWIDCGACHMQLDMDPEDRPDFSEPPEMEGY